MKLKEEDQCSTLLAAESSKKKSRRTFDSIAFSKHLLRCPLLYYFQGFSSSDWRIQHLQAFAGYLLKVQAYLVPEIF